LAVHGQEKTRSAPTNAAPAEQLFAQTVVRGKAARSQEVAMSVRTLIAGSALILFAAVFAMPQVAFAGTVTNATGKFTFWVPDDWKETKESGGAERTSFDSADGSLSVLAGPLKDKDVELTDEDVLDFADDELDDMKVTTDKRDTIEKHDVRLVEGTGKDNNDPIVFKMLALDPGADDQILVVLVYGGSRAMNRAPNLQNVERMLRSIRPR
jgi:hypothetical protein